jgi:hypothetical protein
VIDWALFFLPAAAVNKVGKLAKLSETAIKTVHTVQKTARVAKKTVEKCHHRRQARFEFTLDSDMDEKLGIIK